MDWLSLLIGVIIGLGLADVVRLIAHQIIWRPKSPAVPAPEFQESETPHDPDPPKGPNARISKINFQHRTPVRPTVRKYNAQEDASDPFRE